MMGKRLIRYAGRRWTLPLALTLGGLLAALFLAALMASAAGGTQQTRWTVNWVDNNNETGARPVPSGVGSPFGSPELTVTIDGTEYSFPSGSEEMDQLLLERLGLTVWPTPTITLSGTGTWQVNYGELPATAYAVDEEGKPITTVQDPETGTEGPAPRPCEVAWSAAPPEVEGYGLQVVEDDQGVEDWYYVLEETVVFYLTMRWGNLVELEGISTAIGEAFQLEVLDREGMVIETVPLHELIWDEAAAFWFMAEDGTWKAWSLEAVRAEDPTRFMIQVNDAWRYHLDGSQLTYRVAEKDQDGILDGTELDLTGEDHFSISYDNTNSTNHGSGTDGAYSGGTLYLTLTGTTKYTATKVWQDNYAHENRPAVEFQLWRYRAGAALNTAAPVSDGGGILSQELRAGSTAERVTIDFDGRAAALPKYDSEGYEYIYVVREYIEGSGYTQVFGELDENGGVTKDVVYELGEDGTVGPTGARTQGDTYLYNSGTLNNVRSDTITAEATKIWKAAAFQADFEDVSVELTLQSRPKGEPGALWENTEVMETIGDFTAENLSGVTVSASIPKYDNLGRELEYRWVETGVYQAGADTAFAANADGTARFILQQSDNIRNSQDDTGVVREVAYSSQPSEPVEDPDTSTTTTTITNTLSSTIYYEVDKWWELAGYEGDADSTHKQVGGAWYTKEPDGARNAVFHIYQLSSGQPMEAGAEPYLTFEMEGNGGVQITGGPGADTVSPTGGEDGVWRVRLEGLPEFDQEGQQYEYVLVEEDSTPIYKTNRYSEGYQTEVYNPVGPGRVLLILVQKQWIDGSDTAHRDAVTIQAYRKSDGSPIEGASLVLKNGLWHDWLAISVGEETGVSGIEDIYLREVSVGGAAVESTATEGDQVGYVNTSYHRYEVTYSTFHPLQGDRYQLTVTNRRLGNINLTVTKTWRSGNNAEASLLAQRLEAEGLSLALRLEFHPMTPADSIVTADGQGGVITRHQAGGDTITVGTERVQIENEEGGATASIQEIVIPTAPDSPKETDYYFYHLPKYDLNGTTVRYTVAEGVLDLDSRTFYPLEEYRRSEGADPDVIQALQNWVTAFGEETYISAVDGAESKDLDSQTIPISNGLTGSKSVSWHKVWRDGYTSANGQRPDIYLDIYQMAQGGEMPRLELYQANYKWEREGEDTADCWTAVLSRVPRYDQAGYEITYYAVERTAINAADFDYAPAEYWHDAGGDGAGDVVKIGDRTAVPELYLSQYAADLSGVEAGYPQGYCYALAEGGTFLNRLAAELTINGRKLWTNVPGAFASVDLPAVTFSLFREGEREAVATLKVTDWAGMEENGSYFFWFRYEGDWEISRDDGGRTIYSDGEGNAIAVADGRAVYISSGSEEETSEPPNWAVPLPKYDPDGDLYTYTMEETSIWLNGKEYPISSSNGEVLFSSIFASASVAPGTYQADNVYREGIGRLTIKKWLRLEQVDGVFIYPAVTVELSRTYITNKGEPSDKETVETHIWSSAEVSAAPQYGVEDEKWAELTYTFEGLEQYAPNGSPYAYTVTEDKKNLGGFETWAVDGDVADAGSIAGQMQDENRGEYILIPNPPLEDETVDATLINRRSTPTVILTGTKVWDDWESSTRPGADAITLTVSRYAPSQPGQGNAIGSAGTPVEVAGNAYKVQWDTAAGEDQWSYTIRGTEAGELEEYAPNGMPWTYVVRETMGEESNGYTAQDSMATHTDGPGEGQAIALDRLVNTLKTHASFQKQWQNDDTPADAIREDHLGCDVTVAFQLQVREDSGDWQAAQTYFRDKPEFGFSEESFITTRTARIHAADTAWSGSFTGLPRAVLRDGTTIRLSYRVVETQVHYTLPIGGEEPVEVVVNMEWQGDTCQWNVSAGEEANLITGVTATVNGTATSITNTLKTVNLKVQKLWAGDSGNAYSTRTAGETEGTWKVEFLVQYREAGSTGWKTFLTQTAEGSVPLVVSVCGEDTDSLASYIVEDLPGMAGREYRAVELQPGYPAGQPEAGVITGGGENDLYGATYQASYGEANPTIDRDSGDCTTTVTNTLRTTKVYAEKVWSPDRSEGLAVHMELQYLKAPEDGEAVDAAYRAEAANWAEVPHSEIVLDGTVEDTGDFREYCPWRAVWEGLPCCLPGSYLDSADAATEYRVVEAADNSFIQVGEPAQTTVGEDGTTPPRSGEEAYDLFTFTNLPATTYTVEKHWNSAPAAAQDWEVEVGLYRTTGSEKNGADTDRVLENGAPVTWRLSRAEGWTHTFTGLEKYDGMTGEPYTYYVRELAVEGQKVADGRVSVGGDTFIVICEDGETGTRITNRAEGQITVHKFWWDGGDPERPASVTVGLYIEEADGVLTPAFRPGTREHYSLELTAEDGWTAIFTDLPEYASGRKISYVVRELVAGEPYEPQEEDNGLPAVEMDLEKPTGKPGPADSGSEPLPSGDAPEGGAASESLEEGSEEQEKPPAQEGGIGEIPGPEDAEIPESGEIEAVPEETGGIPGADAQFQTGHVAKASPIPVAGRTLLEGTPQSAGTSGDLESWPAEAQLANTEWEATGEGEVTKDGYVVHYSDHGYTIHNLKYGSLTISKKLTGGDVEVDRTFHFTVTFDYGAAGVPDSGTYAYLKTGPDGNTVEEGRITSGSVITLKGGESATIMDIPAGIAYSVAEEDVSEEGYTSQITDGASSGQIPVGKAVVEFTNRRDPGSLTVTKRVSGSQADYDRGFPFRVTLNDPSGHPLAGDYYVTVDGGTEARLRNGIAEFSLKNGQSATISGLPTGTWYQVEELDTGGYATSVAGMPEGTISAGTGAQVTFWNHRGDGGDETGGLTVTKRVAGSQGDQGADFHFTVTLSNTSINGIYGDMIFSDGAAVFTLRHGQQATATGLPAGVAYTVTEAEAGRDGYTTSAEHMEGTIPQKGISHVTFTNCRGGGDSGGDSGGRLAITKTVAGDGDRNRAFTFTVTLIGANGRELTGTYRYSGDRSGYLSSGGQVALRHGESVTIQDLPVGTHYRVGEVEANQDGYYTTADGDSGQITAGTAYASFCNTLDQPENPSGPDVSHGSDTPDNPGGPEDPDETENPPGPEYGGLTVRKSVGGSAGDIDKAFTFTATLDDPSLSGAYGDMTFTNGVAVFTLSHGEQATAWGLPAGTGYTITEAEANREGYRTTSSGAEGTIPAGMAQVQFLNERDTPDDTPRTGDPTHTGLWAVLALLSLGGTGLLWMTQPGGRGRRLKK